MVHDASEVHRCLGMIFAENRRPSSDQVRGQAFWDQALAAGHFAEEDEKGQVQVIVQVTQQLI